MRLVEDKFEVRVKLSNGLFYKHRLFLTKQDAFTCARRTSRHFKCDTIVFCQSTELVISRFVHAKSKKYKNVLKSKKLTTTKWRPQK